MSDKLYRYESVRYSVTIDAEREIFGTSKAQLRLHEYEIHSETPKGYWIGLFGSKDRWVSKTSRKRFAHPSKEEALEGYRQRKLSYVRHATSNLHRANEDLSLADNQKMTL